MPRNEYMQDVVAVNLKALRVRLLTSEPKTPANAEATLMMAVIRRGVDEEFFATVKAGKYKDGDLWAGDYVRFENSVAVWVAGDDEP